MRFKWNIAYWPNTVSQMGKVRILHGCKQLNVRSSTYNAVTLVGLNDQRAVWTEKLRVENNKFFFFCGIYFCDEITKPVYRVSFCCKWLTLAITTYITRRQSLCFNCFLYHRNEKYASFYGLIATAAMVSGCRVVTPSSGKNARQ
jgi:hypothetical protein